jgi:hypothetical protein
VEPQGVVVGIQDTGEVADGALVEGHPFGFELRDRRRHVVTEKATAAPPAWDFMLGSKADGSLMENVALPALNSAHFTSSK